MDAKSKEAGGDKLYQGLTLNLRSVLTESKCLVKFHNCTNKIILLYWIDYSGNPVKYPTLNPREAITIDTYKSHMFFFKAELDNDERGSQQLSKVLAITQEALIPSCNATVDNFRPLHDKEDKSEPLWICAMCKYVVQRYARRPIRNPCHHYSGVARLSSSDLGVRSHSNFNSVGDLIYSCSDNTHQECHSRKRRNVYLVESFYNLRERCFIQMNERLTVPRMAKLDLPITVLRDYIQFANAFDKCQSV